MRGFDRITGTDEAHQGLDEIVSSDVDFHMERMGPDYMWFVLYDKKGGAQHVDMYAQGDQLIVRVREYEPNGGPQNEMTANPR